MSIVRRLKLPETWDINTARTIEDMFNELTKETQSQFHKIVTSKPDDSEGKEGELWFDKTNNKGYVKLKTEWKEFSVS